MNKETRKKHSKRPKVNTLWAIVTLLLAILIVAAYGLQRTTGGNAQSRTSPFDGQRAFADLTKLVGFGPRPAGSENLAKSRSYIVGELEKAGLKPQLDEFQATTPRGPVNMVNIRAVRSGARPGNTIAVTGHYDTKRFDFNFVGASDGGSSAAWLLEMARVSATLKLDNTLEFIFFDGEEAVLDWTESDSVYGSRHDVDRRYRTGQLDRLKAMILVDMIGDKNLNIRQEAASTLWLRTLIWNTAHSLGYDREFLNESMSIEDDHVPFLRAGVPAVDIIDFDYPYWHMATDTLDKTSARSLKVVGDVIYTALPEIDKRITR